jgi:hypothetical protein
MKPSFQDRSLAIGPSPLNQRGKKLKILLAREKKPNRNIEGNAYITRTPKKRTGIYKEIKTVIV